MHEVEESLQRAVELLPPDSQELREALSGSELTVYARSLYDMLTTNADTRDDIDATNALKEPLQKKKKVAGPKRGRGRVGSANTTLTLAQSILDKDLINAVDELNMNASSLLELAVSRSPAYSSAVSKFVRSCSAGSKSDAALTAIRACNSLAGLCSTSEEAVVSFEPCVNFIIENIEAIGGASSLSLIDNVLCRLSVLICKNRLPQSTDASASASWMQWSERTTDMIGDNLDVVVTATLSRACAVCHDLLYHRVLAEHASIEGDTIDQAAEKLSYYVQITSPYSILGYFFSCTSDDPPKDIASLLLHLASAKAGISCGLQGRKSQVYLMYMHAVRVAINICELNNMSLTKASLITRNSSTQPPVEIMDWLRSHPPSATIQSLLEASSSGLQAISEHITNTTKENELLGLALMASLEIEGKTQGPQVNETQPSAIDHLLFYESTEGDNLHLLPTDWEEDDIDDIEVVGDVEDDSA